MAFSALISYLLVTDTLSFSAFLVFLGIFLLSSGASALNQIQERRFDAKMERTHLRPIPNGALTLTSAWVITLLFMIFGLFILYAAGLWVSLLLGIFSLLWYNGLYTGLKRITVYAMVPGTLTGVIPIMIGWEAAGGNMLNQSFLLICLFMVVWQLPHFILLMLRFRDDYQKAGFPALSDKYSIRTVKDIITSGVVALLTVCLGMLYFDVFHQFLIKITVVIACLAFVIVFMKDLYKKNSQYKVAFIAINIFMMLILLLLLADKLVSNGFYLQNAL